MSSARSIGILTILNVIGAVVALARSIVIAKLFGTVGPISGYFAAYNLEVVVFSLTQTGQLGEVFLPIYLRIKEASGSLSAQQAFSVMINWMLIVVIVVTLSIWWCAPFLIKMMVPGFDETYKILAIQMFRYMLPLLGFQVIFSLVQILANAERWFGKPEAVNVFSRLISVICVLVLAKPLGIWSIIVSMWIGFTLQFLGYIVVLYSMGYRHTLHLKRENFNAWNVFRQMYVVFGYVGMTQVYSVALSAGLSFLPGEGTYSAFSYARNLYAKTNAILLRPISVVFFTHVSEAIAKGAQNVKQLAQQALSKGLAVSAIVIAAVVVAGEPLLAGIWGGDNFGPEDIALSAKLLIALYSFILFSALGQIGRNTVMSLGMVKSQYGAITMIQVISFISALFLIKPLGIPGAFAVIAINYIGLGLAPLFVLLVRKPEVAFFYDLGVLFKWIVAVTAGIIIGMSIRLSFDPHVENLTWIDYLIRAGLFGTVSIITTIAVAWLLKIYEARETFSRIKKKLRI